MSRITDEEYQDEADYRGMEDYSPAGRKTTTNKERKKQKQRIKEQKQR